MTYHKCLRFEIKLEGFSFEQKKTTSFFINFSFLKFFNFLIIFTIDYAPDIIESRNKEARIIDFEIFKSFLFASAQIATKKCNCTHTLTFYLTMREGGLRKLDHGTILNLQFYFFTNTCFLKKQTSTRTVGNLTNFLFPLSMHHFPFLREIK